MRVMLVQSISVESSVNERVYPIGIVALAGVLRRAGHEVGILDMNMSSDPFSALKKLLLEFAPDAVGLSLRNIDPLGNKTTSFAPHFITAVKVVADLLPDAWIIAGGTGFSLFPERLMRELPEIDFGIVGEAEESLPALLSSPGNPPAVKGLCVRKKSGISVAAPSADFDMAEYGTHDYSLLQPSLYQGINSYVPAVGIETKRGCPYSCAYCVYPALQGRRPRCRPPQKVVDEMEFLHKEYGIESFHFTDPVANIPENHLEDICDEIILRKLKIKWDGFMREDRLNEKNIALFEKAGCECFSFSPDGLSGKALEALNKGLSYSDILKASKLASKTDVISVYHFMVNVPGETAGSRSQALRTIETIYNMHSAKRNLGTVVLNNIRILPGTRIEGLARAEGAIGADTDLLYPVYYNPRPFDAMRHELETLHHCRNTFMWQGIL
ncbi:MAG: B12 lower ligand biosynthesis radical SAM protein BzaD [Nitrospirae bacterium]|nr:MAG: B12 lower ligand biosynthesis radical SAM protein BzaD [Nitrospirota bacterium]